MSVAEKMNEIMHCTLNTEEKKALQSAKVITFVGLPVGAAIGYATFRNLRMLGFRTFIGRTVLFAGCMACSVSAVTCVTSSFAISRLKNAELPLSHKLYELDTLIRKQNEQQHF